MYGVLVGTVRRPIPRGGLMTTDNVVHAAAPFVYRPGNTAWSPPDVSRFAGRTFNGYHRSDGRVGTANYWLFIPTVFCENRNLDVIRAALHCALGYAGDDRYSRAVQRLIDAHARGEDVGRADLSLPDPVLKTDRLFKNVDGIKFLNHPGGCGGTRQDAALLSRLLAAYADHPNVGGVTVLSLGCQNLQVQDLDGCRARAEPPVRQTRAHSRSPAKREHGTTDHRSHSAHVRRADRARSHGTPAGAAQRIERGGEVRRQRRLQRHQRQPGRGSLQRPARRPRRQNSPGRVPGVVRGRAGPDRPDPRRRRPPASSCA